jgi:serine/threonine protein kinase
MMTENNSTSGGPETSNGTAPTSSSLPSHAVTVTITTPSQPQQEWPADPTMYQLTGKIGQGAFATVWKAYRLIPSTTSEISASTSTSTAPVPVATTTSNDTVENSTTQDSTNSNNTTSAVATTMVTCAVKVLNLDQADSSNLAEIRLEVQAMRLLSHPNVLACHTAFVNERNLWLITPLMAKGSSLHSLQSIRKFVRRQRRPPTQFADDPTMHPSTRTPTMTIHMEQHIMYILHETIVGLQYIHENLQIHRDIKAGNILIDADGTIKIADFGVSSFLLLQNGSLYQHEKAKTFVGTPCWMAPVSVVVSCAHRACRSDVFVVCTFFVCIHSLKIENHFQSCTVSFIGRR